ncbi:MAG: hypothetical protein V4678_02180 [Patescibacteria group bacterium]
MTMLWIIAGLVLAFGFVAFFGAPYVPSLRGELRRAFKDLYDVGPDDVVVDLGSGDGQVLAEAVRRGANGYGYELNPLLVLASKLRLRSKATIRLADMWSVTLPPETTLVYVFSVTRDSKKLGNYLQKQADLRGRSFTVMTFGSHLKEFTPVKDLRAHTLYEIQPNK